MNPWKLYDDLIERIPDNLSVAYCNSGHNWTMITSSENSVGLAMTIPVFSKPYTETRSIAGLPLKDAARLSKSWNFVEAAIGVAAINSYYNHSQRSTECGIIHASKNENNPDAFDLYQDEIKGKKVAVVGHFPMLERFDNICDLSILERNPSWGDYPDSACEYILDEQDYVFITGCTLVNKTLPRLLALAKNAKIVMVGPSTPMSSILFEHGIYGLSGFTVNDVKNCELTLREGNTMELFKVGDMLDFVNPMKKNK